MYRYIILEKLDPAAQKAYFPSVKINGLMFLADICVCVCVCIYIYIQGGPKVGIQYIIYKLLYHFYYIYTEWAKSRYIVYNI